MIRILIVDDHDLVREGVRALLEREADFEVVGDVGDGQEALRVVRQLRPEVVLMDVNLPGGLGGLETAEAVLSELPETKIIMLTQYENREYIRRALGIGAQGYLPKRSVSHELIDAIRAVMRGRRYLHPIAADELVEIASRGESLKDNTDEIEKLTPRERQVFKLLAEGKTSREIARYLGVSIKTAMSHRSNLMTKLHAHSRAELIRIAIRKGILEA